MFAFLVTVFPYFSKSYNYKPKCPSTWDWKPEDFQYWDWKPERRKTWQHFLAVILWLGESSWTIYNFGEMFERNGNPEPEKNLWCAYLHLLPKNYSNYQGKCCIHGLHPNNLGRIQDPEISNSQAQGACNSWHIPSMLHRIAIPTKSARQRVPLIQDIKPILSAVLTWHLWKSWLVGGWTNPSERYSSKMGIFPK